MLLLLGAFFIATQLLAQNRTVTGKVTDEKGNVVGNASVMVKGSTTGTTTNADGNFSISLPAKAHVLVITSIGLGETEVSLSDASTYSVVLSSTAKSLQEVVVVGYGTQRKTNVTGSIGTVRASEIENKPFTSVDKVLQGTVAGLQSTSTSGAPGAATDIHIRGVGSINASNQPLWVIDGVIATTGDLTTNTTTANILSTLNPDDIESISVLKDASSASIYGSKAANGVIIVTTKRGKGGKTVVNFSTEVGQNDIAYKNKNNRPMTTKEYQTVLEEALINSGDASSIAEADAIITDPVDGFGLKPNVNTNWYDLVTRKGAQQQYNLSLSGGNDKTQFYASGGYFKQEGTALATDFHRLNGALAITHRATDKFTFNANVNVGSTLQRTPSNGGAYANPILNSYLLLPWYSPYNADGSIKYNDPEGQFPYGNSYNPIAVAAWDKATARQTSLRSNVTGEYKILNDLKLTSRFASEYIDVQEDGYLNPLYGDGYSTGGYVTANYNRLFNWTWSNFADYRHKLNDDGSIYLDLRAGYEAQQIKNYYISAQGQGFPSVLDLNYGASAATPVVANSLPKAATTISYFSSGNLNFKNKYVLSGSFRRDGSSVFGTNHRWGNFYSIGGTWNANEENFLKNVYFLSLLKVRASYGKNGNSAGFDYYRSLPTYTYDANYTGEPGSRPNNVGNSDLTWEKNAAADIGLDFGLFKDRLTGSFDYYNRKTTDLLLAVPLSLTSGFGSQYQNVGAMVNKGYEITLGGKPVMTKDFSWSLSINIAHNQNRVTKLYGDRPVVWGTRFNATTGYDVQAIYLREWAGVDPANGDPLWYTDGTHTKTTNKYSSAKQVLVGQADPKYFGALNNTFSYKGITLSAQLYYNFGNNIYDTWDRYLNSDGLYYGALNQLTDQLNSWKKPGDVTNVPKIIYGGNKNSYNHSTRYLYKGDYIRLRDVQLSYVLPKSVTSTIHVSNLSVYVRGTNMFTFGTDKRLPFDPEAGGNNQSNADVFIPKTITAGLKVTL